jgi:hypothetical protein
MTAPVPPCRYLSKPIPGFRQYCKHDEAPWYYCNVDPAHACARCSLYAPAVVAIEAKP